jgi:hypothetical protein
VCEIPVPGQADLKGNVSEDQSANTSPVAVYRRVLEKMGVPSAEVENVKEQLIADFEHTSLPYLQSSSFPEKLAALTKSPVKIRSVPYGSKF